MAKKSRAYQVLSDADDLCKILTGKRLPNHLVRAWNVFGKEAFENWIRMRQAAVPENSLYAVLGIRPDASDIVVKAAWRALVNKTHPDVGGDPVAFQKIQEAYEAIIAERKQASGQ